MQATTTQLKAITLTPTQLKLYKEQCISEYRMRKEKAMSGYVRARFLDALERARPINIAIGIISTIALVAIKGWGALVYMFLSALIGLTIVPTITNALIKKA